MQSTYRSRKFLSLLAILLVALFAFTACGTDNPEAEVVQDAPGVVDAEAVDAEVADAETDAEVDPEAVVEETVDTEGSTETETMTDSETMTDTDVMTDTETVEVITETEVVTDTNVMTETIVTTDTDVMVEGDAEAAEVEAEATAVVEEESADEAAIVTEAGMQMAGVSGAEGALIRGSSLLDYDFDNLNGDVSGDLEDLLIDTNTGNILFASIEYGGFLDIGDKDVIVPLSAFMWTPEGRLVLNFDEQTLENFPDVGNNWPDLTDPAWDDDVNAFWNGLNFGNDIDFNVDEASGVMWLSNLTGFGIGDLGGDVGAVRDVLVNMGNSKVAYAILGMGAGAIMDGGDYVVPFESLNVENMEQNLMGFDADFDMNWLETAPRYDETLYTGNEVLPNDYANDVNTFWSDAGYNLE